MIFQLLETLASCLCAQIVIDGSPEPCFCGVIPGDAVVAEYGGDCDTKCGSAWVRLVNMYPASTVGQQNIQPGNCSSQSGVDIEVGILRCMEYPEDGSPPTSAQLLAATEQQIKDMLTIQRAIVCCSGLSAQDYILGTYTPSGPMGGIVGGAWGLSVVV